ncbi:MAG TPA: selenocysteine-specific translation elongation factor [Thermomicrobiales bacterium]|nr:selenocysteine-specific translation elongation factor [Thermomicrobiales bacterium]
MATTSDMKSPHLNVQDDRRTWVVGTAGHVDHGKSTLVKALTGIDPDRLKEEREREMTIDLGFAWLSLPGGATVSVVDVPGHERFIKNMLSGVGGIDAALLVIAADEGPMPQTAEHLAILDLLEIERVIVVLTKRDLVDDDWLELVTEETRERLAGAVFAGADIVPVSALTGVGLDGLKLALESELRSMPERPTGSRPRLPVDRAFTVAGFGTVVTGTLLDGPLESGQELELLPSRARARVRGLQSHGRKTHRAEPGARTAVNLSGIERDVIQRGDVLTSPGWLSGTRLLDVRLRMVADVPGPLGQNDQVDVFVGAAESIGNVTLLDADRLLPGEEGWVQIRLAREIAAVAGDRLIVRRPSPSVTIGGGRIIDPHPRRHRRFRQEVIASLATRATGDPKDRTLHFLAAGPRDLREIGEQLDIRLVDTHELISQLVATGGLVALGPDSSGSLGPNRLIARRDLVDRTRDDIVMMLEDFHRRQPLRRGMPKEEIKRRLHASARVFDALTLTFVATGAVADLGSLLALPGHSIELSPTEQDAADRFTRALAEQPHSPPAPDGYGLGPDILIALADMGRIVRLPDNVVFGAEQLAAIQRETLTIIEKQGSITLAQFRDHFGSSRKYAQAVLEHFDQQRVTRRVGDARVRGSAAG